MSQQEPVVDARKDSQAKDSQAMAGTPVGGATAASGTGVFIPAPDEDGALPRAFGRYELRRLLGRGGMGRVYLAHDPYLDRLVAIKLPTPVHGFVQWRERFLVEARAAATLNHPNVCPVHDVGEVAGQPYLTMAFVEGETLASRLAREGPLPPDAAVDLVRTVAVAMHEAHRRGIVHRDLKPANLMLDTAGRPVIMDFGLAVRSSSADDMRLTLTGMALGTPAYMSPEQAGGEHDEIGPPSDVYSLGIILYELLTDKVPFKAPTFRKLLAQIEGQAPPSPGQLNSAVDAALEAIVLKALAKAPADRFATAGDLANALDRYQQGDRVALAALYGKPYQVPDRTIDFRPEPITTSRAGPRPPRRRLVWLAAAIVLLAATAAAGVLYVRTDYGDLEVRLSDPKAMVNVLVNGQEVTLTPEGGKPIRIRAGKGQRLEVSGPDYDTVSESFDLKRNGLTIVQVTLKKRELIAKGPPDEPKKGTPKETPVKDKDTKPPEAAPPEKPPPAKPAVFPSKPAVIEHGGWRILTDATKAQMQRWLDERRKENHSVVWLDVFPIAGEPLYSAVALPEAPEHPWTALLDVAVEGVNRAEPDNKLLDPWKTKVLAMSSFRREGDGRVALLAEAGWKRWSIAGDMPAEIIQREMEKAGRAGQSVRVLRPIPVSEDGMVYAFFSIPGERSPTCLACSEAELRDYLAAQQAAGNLPRSIAACVQGGAKLFCAVSAPNKEKSEWLADSSLNLVELKARAAECAAKGFRPASLTAHEWNGEVRYAAVWVKRPFRPTPFPKESTLIESPGWHVLTEASRDEMQQWLADRKKSKHSVLWLDGCAVEGKPVYCAIAALDDRAAAWTALLDVEAGSLADINKRISTKSNYVVALSGYSTDRGHAMISLWRPAVKLWTISPVNTADFIETQVQKGETSGFSTRLIRGYPVGAGGVLYAYYGESRPGVKTTHSLDRTQDDLRVFLDKVKKENYRPISLSSVVKDGQPLFTVVVERDADPRDWRAEVDQTTAALQANAKRHADDGFRPATITAYPWDGQVRYCVVWVKE